MCRGAASPVKEVLADGSVRVAYPNGDGKVIPPQGVPHVLRRPHAAPRSGGGGAVIMPSWLVKGKKVDVWSEGGQRSDTTVYVSTDLLVERTREAGLAEPFYCFSIPSSKRTYIVGKRNTVQTVASGLQSQIWGASSSGNMKSSNSAFAGYRFV